MYKKIFSAVLILFVMASILTVSTASDYSKGDLISYDTASKKIEILNVENESSKENSKKNGINKQDSNKIEDNKNNSESENKKEVSKIEENEDKSQTNLNSNSKDDNQIKTEPNTTDPKPQSKPKPMSKPKPEPESEPQPKPEPKPESKPVTQPQPKPEPKPEPKPQPKPQAPVSSSRQYEKEVIRLVNIERQKNGLSNLTESSKLSNVARYKSQDMINKNYFSHESPTYGSPFNMMKKFGISYSAAGENIAAGQRTPQDVVNAWMNSKGHRANILSNKFNQIGIGFVKDSNNYCFWTQMFIG